MATGLELHTTEKQSCFVCFCGQKNIHKETFPVCGGKCLSHKAVHNWVDKRGERFADDEEVEMEVWKWLRQQSKTSILRVSTHW
jgi:hypothetical protein